MALTEEQIAANQAALDKSGAAYMRAQDNYGASQDELNWLRNDYHLGGAGSGTVASSDKWGNLGYWHKRALRDYSKEVGRLHKRNKKVVESEGVGFGVALAKAGYGKEGDAPTYNNIYANADAGADANLWDRFLWGQKPEDKTAATTQQGTGTVGTRQSMFGPFDYSFRSTNKPFLFGNNWQLGAQRTATSTNSAAASAGTNTNSVAGAASVAVATAEEEAARQKAEEEARRKKAAAEKAAAEKAAAEKAAANTNKTTTAYDGYLASLSNIYGNIEIPEGSKLYKYTSTDGSTKYAFYDLNSKSFMSPMQYTPDGTEKEIYYSPQFMNILSSSTGENNSNEYIQMGNFKMKNPLYGLKTNPMGRLSIGEHIGWTYWNGKWWPLRYNEESKHAVFFNNIKHPQIVKPKNSPTLWTISADKRYLYGLKQGGKINYFVHF